MIDPAVFGKARILVIDDYPSVVMALTYILGTEFGYEVLAADGGMAGLAIAIREKPDLIMLDFDMPVFNGLQVLKGLSIEVGLKDIPVIVMTGRPDKVVRELSLAAGAREVVSKPFDFENLKATLARHLAGKAA